MSDNIPSTGSDDEMNISTYKSVMGFSTKVGVPLAIGLTVMFSSFVLANGWFTSILAGIVSGVFSYFVVKMFFSH